MVKKSQILLFAAIFVAFAILFLYLFTSITSQFNNISAGTTTSGPLSLSASISNPSLVEYNNSHNLVGYALVNYSISNALNGTIETYLYKTNPRMPIYILDTSSTCYQCFEQNTLIYQLTSQLNKYGVLSSSSQLRTITQAELPALPPNSILIVSSGLFPIAMLPQSGYSGVNIEDLLHNNDTIIYIGTNFSKSVGQGGTIYSTPDISLTVLNALGLGTSPQDSAFSGQNQFLFNSPTFAFPTGLRGVSSNFVSAAGGSVFVFSNYPTTAWANASGEASDIAKAIWLRTWEIPDASKTYELNSTFLSKKGIGVFTFNTTLKRNDTDSEYLLVKVNAYNGSDFKTEEFVSALNYTPRGSLSAPSSVGQSQSGQVQVNLNPGTFYGSVSFHIDLLNAVGDHIATITLGAINASQDLGVIKYYTFALPSGEYTAVLRDFRNVYYAASAITVSPMSIIPINLDYKNNTFAFNFASAGIPVQGQQFNVSLNGLYPSSGVITNGTAIYTLPNGAVVPYGDEQFNFIISGQSYSYVTTYQKQVLNIPAFYIQYAVVVLVVILINIIIKPPNRDEYFIDVQDLPAQKKVKVNMKSGEILNIFDRTNATYRWKFMPLTIEEVKSAISKNLRFNNMAISITTQNASNLLSEMVSRKLLANSDAYYAPISYVNQSKHDIEFLSIFRKLRDKCIARAILVTDIDTSPEADAVLMKNGAKVYVAIYTKESGISKVKISTESKWFVVFRDGDRLEDFREELHTSYGEQAEMLKMGISYGSLKLATVDEIADHAF